MFLQLSVNHICRLNNDQFGLLNENMKTHVMFYIKFDFKAVTIDIVFLKPHSCTIVRNAELAFIFIPQQTPTF